MTMKYNHVMRTSCLAALICLSLSAVSLANGPVTDSTKASDPAFSVPVSIRRKDLGRKKI